MTDRDRFTDVQPYEAKAVFNAADQWHALWKAQRAAGLSVPTGADVARTALHILEVQGAEAVKDFLIRTLELEASRKSFTGTLDHAVEPATLHSWILKAADELAPRSRTDQLPGNFPNLFQGYES